jgi:hypothetical protein
MLSPTEPVVMATTETEIITKMVVGIEIGIEMTAILITESATEIVIGIIDA